MPQGTFVAGWFQPISGSLPPYPGWSPEHPWVPPGPEVQPPIEIPPLPPGIPDQGLPPMVGGGPPGSPGTPEYPIEIPSTPEHPIALPPGSIWPPLGPGEGVQGKCLLLVVVPGAAKKAHWVVVDVPPGIPQPK